MILEEEGEEGSRIFTNEEKPMGNDFGEEELETQNYLEGKSILEQRKEELETL